MIRFIIIALLVLSVVAFTPMLMSEPGYIAIAMGGKIVEMTVYTAVFWLGFSLLMLFIFFRLLRGSYKLSFGGWRKIVFASHRRAIKDFNKGIAAYVLGDYQQAEHLLAKSAEPAHQQQTAYLLAASAAEKQKLRPNTQHYLALLEHHNSDQYIVKTTGLELVIVKIQLLMSHKEYRQARLVIDEYHKHIGHDARLLQLEIDLCLIEKRYEATIQHLVLARKQKDFNQKKLENSENIAFTGMFNELIRQHDQQTLVSYWQKLAKKIKQREAVLFAYCQILAENGLVAPLEKLLLPALRKEANDSFIQQLTNLPLAKTTDKAETFIAAVQKHLHNDQHNIKWLACLGHLALAGGQWQMSEKAFHSLFSVDGYKVNNEDLKACALALSKQSKHHQANELLQKIFN
jgi:HemY protein